MRIAGSHSFSAAPAEVYERFLDADALRPCIAGCRRLEAVGDGRFELEMAVPIPAVRGSYAGTMEVLERQPPSGLRLRIEARGDSGFVTADARLRLEADGEGTLVHYEADADVGGPVASVGQRVISGITRRQLEQTLRCLDSGRPAGLLARIRRWLRSLLGRSES